MPRTLTDKEKERVQKAASCIEPPFIALLKVLKVVVQRRPLDPTPMDVFTILVDGGIRLQATRLHAFKVSREGQWEFVSAEQIQPGDQMWVDVPMYFGDGSLYFHKSPSREPA